MTTTPQQTSADPEPEQPNDAKQLFKSLIELGPLLIFLAVYMLTKNMFYGTAALMVATLVALAVSWVLFGRVPVMPLVSGALVLVFGGLTLWLKDEAFIKLKPTILYTMFATALATGVLFKQYYLRHVFGEVFRLSPTGWYQLTVRWIGFFIALAILNELVWRNFSNDTWLWFKLAMLPVTAAFGVAQLGLLKQYADPAPSA